MAVFRAALGVGSAAFSDAVLHVGFAMVFLVLIACSRAPSASPPARSEGIPVVAPDFQGQGRPAERMPDGMILLAGGTFDMGSDDSDANSNEQPIHSVHVAPFYLDRTEVTVESYGACVAARHCTKPDPFVNERRNFHIFCNWDHPEGRARHPINCVDWHQAVAFCHVHGKRLPTEEEWEYAARGGPLQRKYPWGNQRPTELFLNACGTECPENTAARGFPGWPPMYPASDGWPETAPVGSFPVGASADGLLDLAGNVWEWTDSAYSDYPSASGGSSRIANSDTDSGEPKRVMRGGSWGGGDARTERATNRFKLTPSSRSQFLGFRCAHGELR